MPTLTYPHWRDVPATAWRWPNFSAAEIACRGTGAIKINTEAMDKLQALRDRLGKPLIIRSAYRSPEHNRAVGGAPASKHMQGTAFDIAMSNHDPAAFEAAARAVGFLGFAELGRDKLCCLIIASLSGLLGLSHSVLQTSILRLELLHLTGKIGDLRIKVGHVRTQRLGGLTAGYRLTSKSLDGFRDLIKEVIDLVDIITFLESNSLEGVLPNILRRQQSHKSCTSLWGIARTYVGLKSECYHDPIVSEHSTWVFMPDICLRRVKNGLRTLSEQHFPVPPAQNTAQ